ncbi:MAG TPA: ATP-binding cassette domain-containing protein [Kiritimatiellia bacterium]|nr:ATP-binding cassette domain-containing protein [Kiritimatiellia bacterium]HRZ12249.1 ATP-binding cassette domain-containing protein [Kiritimatiellia bacterium]HSA17993.1 ATP-binding cassette domain-containing protein [Kiritimatiellia bacterium]
MNIALENISKRFGEVQANEGISLAVPAGTIHGILGENGAGKSTLMKILSGFIRADSGRTFLDGAPAQIRGPADAIRLGIGMLHQDPLDFPPMTAVDNFLAGRTGAWRLSRPDARRELEERQADFDFRVDPGARVENLTVGERQQLEMVRLLSLGARALILDEPTTGISALQKDRLFAALRKLAADGKSIILISHKLRDVEMLCDEVTVLRRARVAGRAQAPYDLNELVRLMFGRVVTREPRLEVPTGGPLLTLDGLAVEDHRLRLAGLNLEIRAGEVIGLAGLEGSGQELFLRACGGLLRPAAGRLRLAGRDLAGEPYPVFRDAGIAYVPAARLEEGLVAGLTPAEHFAIVEPGGGLVIDWKLTMEQAERRIAEYDIRGAATGPVDSLSGGNQQRALLSLLPPGLCLVLLEHPTRGLDVESASAIWRKLLDRCADGAALVFTSSDLEEILQYSDRVLVFFGGQVAGPVPASAMTVERLGEMMGGQP